MTKTVASKAGWRTDMEKAPEREDVLVYWPFYKLDDNLDLTDEQDGGRRVIAQRSGDHWDDFGSLEGVGHYFGDDNEPGHKPTYWAPLLPDPQ